MIDFMKAVNVIFRYKTFTPDEEKEKYITAVDDVSLSIKKGDFVGILGHNGSGKSTLAKQLAGLLTPTEGYVYVDGLDTKKPEHSLSVRKTAGIVFQNPDNQLIGNVVEEDIAFGPENLGLPREEIWSRVADALEATAMSAYRFKSPKALSGGQKQKIAISGILAMEPECIILDEPTAMLDPRGRKEVMEAIRHLNKEKNITIILITHHMEEVEDADYLYVMKSGKITAQGKAKEIWKLNDLLEDCGIGLPFDRQLFDKLKDYGIHFTEDVDEDEMIRCLVNGNYRFRYPSSDAGNCATSSEAGKNLNTEKFAGKESHLSEKYSEFQFENVSYSYGDQWQEEAQYALKNISFSIKQGEYIAVIGKTGSGKSTLLQHMNALLTPTEGICSFNGKNMQDKDVSLKAIRQKVSLCFQYPEYQLFEETVLKDICFGPSNLGYSEEECIRKARQAMKLMGLSEEMEQVSPFALSGGQKRRVALAGILAMEPEFLILDEPVAGMDKSGKDNLFAILKRLNEENNVGILLVSHDMNDVASHAKRLVVMDQGEIKMDGPARDIFMEKEAFQSMDLELPQSVSFYHKLKKAGMDLGEILPMTVAELAESISEGIMKHKTEYQGEKKMSKNQKAKNPERIQVDL